MKMRAQLVTTVAKIEKLHKMESERSAYESYKAEIEGVWHALDFDAAVSLAIYASAFDTDQTSQLNHLYMARRRFKRSFKLLSPEALVGDKRDMSQHPTLTYEKTIIMEQTPDYNTDLDIEHETDHTMKDPLTQTKAVRGEGKRATRKRRSEEI